MIEAKRLKLEEGLHRLCTALLPHLPRAMDAMEYVRAGEYGLALEMLSDWLVDVEPEMSVSVDDLVRFVELGESMEVQRAWVNLLPLVDSAEVRRLPEEIARMAREFLRSERGANPQRERWLRRVEGVLERVEESPRGGSA
jgi:hypothetical protein